MAEKYSTLEHRHKIQTQWKNQNHLLHDGLLMSPNLITPPGKNVVTISAASKSHSQRMLELQNGSHKFKSKNVVTHLGIGTLKSLLKVGSNLLCQF